MLWFLIVLAGIGLTVQAWLTIRGFGPPSPPDQLDPDYRRPLHTFEQTITAALSLHVFKTTP